MEQVVSTTSFITEPLPALKVSDQKVDRDATSVASVYTRRTITMTYIRNSFRRYYHYTREKERNQLGRRRQSILCAYFKGALYKMQTGHVS